LPGYSKQISAGALMPEIFRGYSLGTMLSMGGILLLRLIIIIQFIKW